MISSLPSCKVQPLEAKNSMTLEDFHQIFPLFQTNSNPMQNPSVDSLVTCPIENHPTKLTNLTCARWRVPHSKHIQLQQMASLRLVEMVFAVHRSRLLSPYYHLLVIPWSREASSWWWRPSVAASVMPVVFEPIFWASLAEISAVSTFPSLSDRVNCQTWCWHLNHMKAWRVIAVSPSDVTPRTERTREKESERNEEWSLQMNAFPNTACVSLDMFGEFKIRAHTQCL